ELLQREGRVAYRVLKRRFNIDDEYVEDLKADLIDAKRVAVDEDGKVLVWVGASPVQRSMLQAPSVLQSPIPNPQSPVSYTPPHLAERIRAEQAAFPEVEYIFKHALTQEVAYGTVLLEQRKVLHEETARAIEQLFHDHLDEHYDELAHHYER